MSLVPFIAGVDEAGRGPLAGPVVAAAVILDHDKPMVSLRDSKKLSAKQREALFQQITEQALCYAVAVIEPQQIDAMNILQATLLAMQQALEQLELVPHEAWIDGNQAPTVRYPCRTIIDGDNLEPCISAASILAKVTRDRLMLEWHQQYPQYGFAQHKGYATKQHLGALAQHGPCPIHRQSFAPVRQGLVVRQDR